MHEVSLVAALADAVERQAAGRPVRSIVVRHASSVTATSIRQALSLLGDSDGRLVGVDVRLDPFEVRLACPCGFDGPLGHDDLIGGSIAVCPTCGDVRTLHRTAELELVEVLTGP